MEEENEMENETSDLDRNSEVSSLPVCLPPASATPPSSSSSSSSSSCAAYFPYPRRGGALPWWMLVGLWVVSVSLLFVRVRFGQVHHSPQGTAGCAAAARHGEAQVAHPQGDVPHRTRSAQAWAAGDE